MVVEGSASVSRRDWLHTFLIWLSTPVNKLCAIFEELSWCIDKLLNLILDVVSASGAHCVDVRWEKGMGKRRAGCKLTWDVWKAAIGPRNLPITGEIVAMENYVTHAVSVIV